MNDCVLALGFEKMEQRLARREVHRPHAPDGPAHAGHDVDAGVRVGAGGGADVRRCRPRAHGEVRHDEASSFAKIAVKNRRHAVNKPALAVPAGVQPRRDSRRADDLRAAHQAPVLPDERRRRRPRSSARRSSRRSTASTRASSIPAMTMTTDYPSSFEQSMINMVGQDLTRAAARTRSTSKAGSGRRTSRSSSCTTASRRTSSSPTRASGCAARARPGSWSTRTRRPTAANGW